MQAFALHRARKPASPKGLPLMKAAAAVKIDHRWIWLWAEQGLVRHLEVESTEGRHKTFYVMEDVERLAAQIGKSPYPAESVPTYRRELLAVSA